ncbi:hypothetical protein HYX16_06470 [Candidatus Woesearchaeota archaeon]|nr:hypothetical protein [Candidatus Woesearchaeota archaeon]
MYKTKSWRISAPTKGLQAYMASEVFFWPGHKVTKSKELDEHIEDTWRLELQRNSKLTNGSLIRLSRLNVYDFSKTLDLFVSLTDYQEYKATCVPEHKRRFEAKYRRTFRDDEKAHTFASATLPITLDDKVVFLQRSSDVDLFRGYFNLPSGGRWDGDLKETIEDMDGYGERLFRRCMKIVEKEFNKNIKLKENTQKLYGIAETVEHGESTFDDHILEFSIRLEESSDELLRKKDKIATGKYCDIVVVDFEEAKLADFLNANLERIPDSIQPAVVVAGAHKFGEDWPLAIKGVERIEPKK